jgi:hypothetical protein
MHSGSSHARTGRASLVVAGIGLFALGGVTGAIAGDRSHRAAEWGAV